MKKTGVVRRRIKGKSPFWIMACRRPYSLSSVPSLTQSQYPTVKRGPFLRMKKEKEKRKYNRPLEWIANLGPPLSLAPLRGKKKMGEERFSVHADFLCWLFVFFRSSEVGLRRSTGRTQKFPSSLSSPKGGEKRKKNNE